MRCVAKSPYLVACTAFAVFLLTAPLAQAQYRRAPPRSGAYHGEVVACASVDQHTRRCRVPWRNARLVHQDSSAACVRGRSWGVRRGEIWVSNGCRGQFAEARGRRGDRGRRWQRDIPLRCASHGYNYQMCRVDVGRRGDVILTRQMSSTRCVRGQTWGWNRAGVWVDRGCDARFLVHRR